MLLFFLKDLRLLLVAKISVCIFFLEPAGFVLFFSFTKHTAPSFSPTFRVHVFFICFGCQRILGIRKSFGSQPLLSELWFGCPASGSDALVLAGLPQGGCPAPSTVE